MGNHEDFNIQAVIISHQVYKASLQQLYPDWTPAMLDKQAQIATAEAYQNQVRSYFAERHGIKISHVDQSYKIIDRDLVDPYFGKFQSMIDHATTDIERNELEGFRNRVFTALPGEEIRVLDTSGLGLGKGIRYFDTYEKGEDGIIRHKERVDFAEDGKDFTYEEAKEFLFNLDLPNTQPLFEQFQPQPITEIQLTESIPEYQTEIALPAVVPAEKTSQSETQLSLPATTNFWFEAAAVPTAVPPNIVETPAPVFEIPSGSHLEDPIELVASNLTVKETPTRLDLVGPEQTELIVEREPEQVPAKTVFAGPKTAEPEAAVSVNFSHSEPPIKTSGSDLEILTRIVLVGRDTVKSDAPPKKEAKKIVTRLLSDTIEPSKTVFVGPWPEIVVYQQVKPRGVVLPPEWGIKLELLNDKEIPIWPPNFDDFENNDALVLVVVTTFFLIANTVWQRRARTFFDDRGSGELQPRVATALS